MGKCVRCPWIREKFLLDGRRYSCKHQTPFCKLSDTRLAELYAREREPLPLPMDTHLGLSRAVQDGQIRARSAVERLIVRMPFSPAELVEAAEYLHQLIFQRTGLEFAGRFRLPGEPDVYFGTHKNERKGVDPAQIVDRLAELYYGTVCNDYRPMNARSTLIRCCARFLEEFFAIHPFHDGNGRVARLLLRVFARSTDFYYFDVFPEDRKSRRKYTQALVFAHKHSRVYNDDASGVGLNASSGAALVTDPYKFIVRWLDACLRDHREKEPEDLQPEWLESDRAEPEEEAEPDLLDGYDLDNPHWSG